MQWMWHRENRRTFLTEFVRSQQIKAMLKDTFGQEEDQVLAHCRALYTYIKDQYPKYLIPAKVCSLVWFTGVQHV